MTYIKINVHLPIINRAWMTFDPSFDICGPSPMGLLGILVDNQASGRHWAKLLCLNLHSKEKRGPCILLVMTGASTSMNVFLSLIRSLHPLATFVQRTQAVVKGKGKKRKPKNPVSMNIKLRNIQRKLDNYIGSMLTLILLPPLRFSCLRVPLSFDWEQNATRALELS